MRVRRCRQMRQIPIPRKAVRTTFQRLNSTTKSSLHPKRITAVNMRHRQHCGCWGRLPNFNRANWRRLCLLFSIAHSFLRMKRNRWQFFFYFFFFLHNGSLSLFLLNFTKIHSAEGQDEERADRTSGNWKQMVLFQDHIRRKTVLKNGNERFTVPLPSPRGCATAALICDAPCWSP